MPGSAKEYCEVPVCQSAKDDWYLSGCTGVLGSVLECQEVQRLHRISCCPH